MLNNTATFKKSQIPSLHFCDNSITLRLEWGNVEIERLREIKDQIQQENNPFLRYALEIELHKRVQKYICTISATMLEILKHETFYDLPTEEQIKVLDWAALASGGNSA